jgi:hypothetical protein
MKAKYRNTHRKLLRKHVYRAPQMRNATPHKKKTHRNSQTVRKFSTYSRYVLYILVHIPIILSRNQRRILNDTHAQKVALSHSMSFCSSSEQSPLVQGFVQQPRPFSTCSGLSFSAFFSPFGPARSGLCCGPESGPSEDSQEGLAFRSQAPGLTFARKLVTAPFQGVFSPGRLPDFRKAVLR